MKNTPAPYFYSRVPTESAPCAVLHGPFPSEGAARRHLMDTVRESCEDPLMPLCPFGPYKVFKHVSTVQPLVKVNVRLKEHA